MEDDKSGFLSEQDRQLWLAYIEQERIITLKTDNSIDFETLMAEADPQIQKSRFSAPKIFPEAPAEILPKKTDNHRGSELDRRTSQKLQRGQIAIEARCDLHGLNRVEAYALLEHFIRQSAIKGRRCVLVITGKGRPRLQNDEAVLQERGVLRENVPRWLAEPKFLSMVLKTQIAKPKDGGSGALYVYLRK